MSLSSWGASNDPALTAEDCQKACDEASAMLQQFSRAELQNLVDDSDALNRLIADLEKVTFCFVHPSDHVSYFARCISQLVCETLIYETHVQNAAVKVNIQCYL